jgi:hypothetical protein
VIEPAYPPIFDITAPKVLTDQYIFSYLEDYLNFILKKPNLEVLSSTKAISESEFS